jgi:TolB-like protein
MNIVLARPEFDSAVKDALRYFTRADLLATNKLLDAHVMRQRGPAFAGAHGLRTMLTETAETLFSNARDEKIHRVLKLTYFDPEPKQEAAADRLGLSFSTFRRYLGTGVGRLVEFLWRLEQDSFAVEPQRGVTCSIVDKPRQQNTRRLLSVIILPFLDLSPNRALGYLVDGIVDSLMTDLSHTLSNSVIISRSTAFTYKDRQVSVRQIGDELAVRYVLEGSVMADAALIRVNVQLIDAQTDEHLWADRFDKERGEALQVQDEVVARLSRSIGIEMLRHDAKSIQCVNDAVGSAVDMVTCAKALAMDIRQKDHATRAVSLFRRALVLDPENVDAMIGIASTCIFQLLNQYRFEDRDRLLNEAGDLVGRAFAVAPSHVGVLKTRACLLRAQGRFEEAIFSVLTVLQRNPGEPTACREMGLNKLYLGETLQAIDWFRRADRIAPSDPGRWTWLQGLGRGLMQLGRDAEATDVLQLGTDCNPWWLPGKALLAASKALTGNLACARRLMAEYTAAEPEMTIRAFSSERASVPLAAASPIYCRESQRIYAGLRLAGMAE